MKPAGKLDELSDEDLENIAGGIGVLSDEEWKKGGGGIDAFTSATVIATFIAGATGISAIMGMDKGKWAR